MEIFTQTGGEMLSRWGHYLAGVTWIGLLYYFNFVQTPAFAQFEAGPRNEATAKLVPRALWWFRYGALLTLLTGLSILAFQENLFEMDYYKTAPGMSIATGILLAVIMFLNVWGIIWRRQKIVIANAQGVLAGREADPAAATAARQGATASRTNTLFSIPMLFFMGATSHFAGRYDFEPSGGKRAIYWIITLVVVGVIEFIAIKAPPAGSPQTAHLDQHRNTIIAGFVLAVLMILLWEILF